jgi:hypothetical protein
VVSTDGWGAADIIRSDDLGIIIEKRDPQSIARALTLALQKKWNTIKLVHYAGANTWQDKAGQIDAVFQRCIANNQALSKS